MTGGKHKHMRKWTTEESEFLLQLVAQYGSRWSKIVKHFPDRTLSCVRNHWQRLDKAAKLSQRGVKSRNKCLACGEPKLGHICEAKRGGGPKVAIGPVLAPPELSPPTIGGRGVAPFGPLVRPTRTCGASTSVPQMLEGRGEPVGASSGLLLGEHPPAAVLQPLTLQRSSSLPNKSFIEAGLGELASNDDAARQALADAAAKSDEIVPPAVARWPSGEAPDPPKVTRSPSSLAGSFLCEILDGAPPAVGGLPGPGGLSAPSNLSLSSFSTFFGPAGCPLASAPPLELPADLGQDFGGSEASSSCSFLSSLPSLLSFSLFPPSSG